jgi:hypothetical protein
MIALQRRSRLPGQPDAGPHEPLTANSLCT